MVLDSIIRRVRHDPEQRALRALASALETLRPKHRPDESLQLLADLARELTGASYSALAITDADNNTEGFFVSGLDSATLRRLRTAPQGHGPLGSLRFDGRPVRFEDVSEHAKAFGFPGNHPDMQRLMGVAIWANAEVRGALYVTDRADGELFDDDDERTLLTLADHASKVVVTEWY
jgi:two-component system, NarL family, sensor histidine kinase DevS